MAQKVNTFYISDLSESQDDVENVEFGLDGIDYEIDLDATERTKLRDALADYVAHARRTGRTSNKTRTSPGKRTGAVMTRHSSTNTPRPERGRSKEIREWAVAQGYELSTRGRIPANVTEAYDAAH
jgi:hypothetical protein